MCFAILFHWLYIDTFCFHLGMQIGLGAIQAALMMVRCDNLYSQLGFSIIFGLDVKNMSLTLCNMFAPFYIPGNEPSYMTDNAMWYLYSQLSDCCQEHYQWNYDECIGSSKKPYSALFYPDWETGINVGCKTGGGQPVVRCLEVIISMVIITLLTQSHLRPNHLVNSI